MSKEEFLKIQTCVLKVNIHCDGCKRKVKKILQKIDGVYTTNIDSEQGKVTVSGNVDPATLIRKLSKGGKHAELWVEPKAKNNQLNQLNNQFKNIQIGHGKGGQNKGQQGGQKGSNNQPKGGASGGGGALNPQQQQQLQMLQQLKGVQDLKLPPQFKDLKMPLNGKDPNQKAVKFNLPEEDDLSDDEFDDFDDDDEFDDDELDDEMEGAPLNRMKPMLGNGQGGAAAGSQIPPNIMMNMMNGQHPLPMKGGNNGGNGGGNGKKGGGGGNIPVQYNGMGGANSGSGGKKGGGGGNNGNNNQNSGAGGGGGGAAKNGGKNGNGQPANGGNKGGNGGGGGGGGNVNMISNGGNNGGGGMNDGLHGMPKMMGMNAAGNVGQMGNIPMGQMGQMPMAQMGNMAAVQGLPAGMNGGGGGYFQGANPEVMAAYQQQQQQMATMMMNQQRANGNERFQPMMYARPPPAVNYMPPYNYPYPPPPHPNDTFNYFSDENPSACNIM